MKRTILIMLLLGLAALCVEARDGLVVGIDQGTAAEWETTVASFEAQTGVSVQLRPYPKATIAQQIIFQAYRRSGQIHLVMVPSSWGSSLARFLVDLSEDVPELESHGIEPIYVGGQPIGIPLPFTSDWFLSVLAWPETRQHAMDFLVHAGTANAAPSQATIPVEIASTPEAAAAAFAKQKLPAADHNPLLDGALEVLLGASRASDKAHSALAMATSVARSAIANLASQYGVPFSSSVGTVTVVLETRAGQSPASTAAGLAALGVSRSAIEMTSTLIKATVSLDQLSDLATGLRGIAYIRPPYTPFPLGTATQGVAAIGADAFHAAGFDGAGVKIAVIDLGFAGLSQAQASGDLPYALQQNDFTGTGLTSGITHGTAVAEIIHDIAPAAELHLLKIADEVDLDAAVTYCLTQGIDVINHSLGWYNTNFYDGTGTIADAARRAISGGILWVNAAGNEAESHWEGIFSDANSDGWLDREITLPVSSGETIVLFLTWNDWPQASSDYDLYLYDPSSTLIASSTKYQTGSEEPTEFIQALAPISGTYTVRIQGSGYKSLELFSLSHAVAPVVASSSILAPGNVSEAVTVGAIDHANYTTGPQESYSSQGPTNDGRAKPDLCAPDRVSTGTSPYTTFFGTSGAAPHVAAAATLLLQRTPSLTEAALRSQLISQVVPMGSPNIYGNGRLYLQPPTAANQSPIAAFSLSPTSPVAGAPVSFDAAASADPDGSIVSYTWSFGDGGSGSGPTTTHTYASHGTYTAQLTVTDNDGASDTTTSSVSVSSPANQPPTAAFSLSPTSPVAGAPVSFDAAASADPDGSIVSYIWSFGDGGSGSGPTTTHTYASPGTYTAQLTVTDNGGASDTEIRALLVQSAGLPDLTVISISHTPQTPLVGQSVAFTVTVRNSGTAAAGPFRVRLASTAVSTYGYVSQLPAGGSRDLELVLPLTATAETFVANADDLHQVTEQDEINNTRSTTVISAAPPVLADAGGPYTGIAGSSISFSGSGSTGSITTYLWSFGDGATGQGITVAHAYSLPGTYTVTLTVFGSNGQQSTDSTQAVVSAANPPLAVQLSLPKSSYEVGEAFAVSFTTNRTAYVYLCDVSADGRVTLMRPNWLESGNPLPGGVHHVPGGGYTLRITEPIGTETLYLFAATSPLPHFPTSFGAGFPLLSTNPTSFRSSVLGTMQAQLPSGEWAYDTLSFQVISPPPTTGALQVSSSPSGATVHLDGQGIGITPLLRQSVAPGIHTVQLSLAGHTSETRQVVVSAGQTATVNVMLAPSAVNVPPVADYIYTPPSPTTGTPITFNATSAYDPDGSIVMYSWSFGDSATASGPIVNHTYASPGTYIVQLTVTDNHGASDTTSSSISVSSPANQPPSAMFSLSPAPPVVGTSVNFNATTSTDPDGSIVSYTWSFGDGGSASGPTTTHTYAAPGTYIVQLTVIDNHGASDTTSSSISVSLPANQPPSAMFSFSPASPGAGTPVSFDGATSSDPDGSIVSYTWDFGDGTSASGSAVSHTFTTEGSYAVHLTVTDNDGATNATVHTVSVGSLADVGWISPASVRTNNDKWFDTENTHDRDMSSFTRSYGIRYPEYSDFLYAYAPDPTPLCDGVRLFSYDSFPTGNALLWDVDVYQDEEWIDVFEGAINEQEWKQISFAPAEVTIVRIRARTTQSYAASIVGARITEMDFHDATSP